MRLDFAASALTQSFDKGLGLELRTLSGGDQYAIRGTNVPGTVGGFVSYGCFRMYNQNALDLFSRVSVGMSVVVTR